MSAVTYPVKATDSTDLEAVLLERYPNAYRLAVGLCGGATTAGEVAATVLKRAARLAPRWTSAEAADRWFLRFTVLESRPVRRGEADEPRWLASLPFQQREVVVLYHGLGLDLHQAAAAMDCSTTAAANHLVAATKALQAIGLEDTWSAELPKHLATIVPPPAVLSGQVGRVVSRNRWSRRIRRAAALALVTAGLAAIGWAAWNLSHVLIL